jgi:GH24 family phage-related lysozyme (muramidase)
MNEHLSMMNPIAAELAKTQVAKAEPKVFPSDVEMLYKHLGTKGIEDKLNDAYYDKVGKVWTIGIGSTGAGIKEGVRWTDEEIRSDFNNRAMNNRKVLEEQYGTMFNAMNDNQKMVVQSLLWNAGPAALDNWPTMRKAMQTKDPKKIKEAIKVFSAEIPTIRKSGGKVVPALERRRAIEKNIFDEAK